MKYILKNLKMKNKIMLYKNILIMLLVICMISALYSEETEFVLDAAFFKDFNSKPLIQRDDLFESLSNKIVIGRGTITGISVNERYKKKYRLVIESSDSSAFDSKIIFFVFLENKDTVDLLSLNTRFEFKGQLMGYTPLGTKRSEYILDIILMDGSTLIE